MANLRLVVGVLIAVSAWGQACPQLGLNTVEEAENRFYANRKLEARRLLEKAYSQCRREGPVLRRIAEAYRTIGDDAESERFSRLADEVGAAQNIRLTKSDDQQASVPLPTFVRKKFALVVGVSKFKDFSSANRQIQSGEVPVQKIPDLQFAAKDANDFYTALVSPEIGRFQRDRVERLLDSEVTADHVRRAISDIEQKADEDDLVVLFFSSHGSSPDMDPAASNARSGFILMNDTEYRASLNTATAYPMYELVTAINRFRARRVIAFLDTCYSGDTINAKGARAIGEASGSKGLMVGLEEAEQIVHAVPQDRARVVITSSNANERSWESETLGNGYFTKYLIDALGKESGQWNISQVYRYLNDNVPTAVEREKGGAPQHPQLRSFPSPRLEINVVIGSPETEGR